MLVFCTISYYYVVLLLNGEAYELQETIPKI